MKAFGLGILWFLVAATYVFLMATGLGCKLPPVEHPTQKLDGGHSFGPSCAVDVNVTPEDVCLNFYTRTGLACARCRNANACIDSVTVVYCVTDNCRDPVCTYIPNTDPMLMKPTTKHE